LATPLPTHAQQEELEAGLTHFCGTLLPDWISVAVIFTFYTLVYLGIYLEERNKKGFYGKVTNKIGETGWNFILGYKFLPRVNLLGGAYFSSSLGRRALKRV
jgi:hypothetical protein